MNESVDKILLLFLKLIPSLSLYIYIYTCTSPVQLFYNQLICIKQLINTVKLSKVLSFVYDMIQQKYL